MSSQQALALSNAPRPVSCIECVRLDALAWKHKRALPTRNRTKSWVTDQTRCWRLVWMSAAQPELSIWKGNAASDTVSAFVSPGMWKDGFR